MLRMLPFGSNLGVRVLLAALAVALSTCSNKAPTEEITRTSSAVGSCGVAVLPIAAAAASSEQNGGYFKASWSIDGDMATRWSSSQGAPQWLRLDLGSRRHIGSVIIDWERAFSPSYDIQVSDDASSWTVVRAVRNSTGGHEEVSGISASARYVRFLANQMSSYGSVSIFEVKIMGDSDPACDPTPPQCTESETARLAISATLASSVEQSCMQASATIDGDYGTRWSSAFADNQWLAIDLGTTAHVKQLRIVWESAYAKSYVIEAGNSLNGAWTTVATKTDGSGGVETVPVSTNTRFLRVRALTRSSCYGVSIWELEVYGSLSYCGSAQGPGKACQLQQRGGHDYWFCSDLASREQAERNCGTVGTRLASIDDDAENQFLKGHISAASFTGLTDTANEGAWRWQAGGKLNWCGDSQGGLASSTSYAHWAASNPQEATCRYATYGGHGYWICDAKVSWQAASTACRGAGMSLASINSAAENAFLETNMGTVSARWAGAREDQPGTWTWATGETLGTSEFSAWTSPTGPSSGSPRCLALKKTSGNAWQKLDCAQLRDFVCEGPATANPVAPHVIDCATLGTDGVWRSVACDTVAGYVCETPPVDSEKTLDQLARSVRGDYRTGGPRVSAVDFSPAAGVDDPFSRFSVRLGLRECVDRLEPTGAAAVALPNLGVEAVVYDQTYRGIPVVSRGYTVHRDPVTKQVKSFTGRIETALDVGITATVAEPTAYPTAVTALARQTPTSYALGRGKLVVYPRTHGPHAQWDLVWSFAAAGRNGENVADVAVSARDGTVLAANTSIVSACASAVVPAGTITPTDITVSDFQQTRWQDPANARAQAVTSSTLPVLLNANGIDANAGSPLYEKPAIFVQCPGELYPTVAGLDAPAITVAGNNAPANYFAASIYMSAQRCLQYFSKNFETREKTAWVGLDGSGTRKIDIRLDPFGTLGNIMANFDFKDYSIHFDQGSLPYQGAAIELACHEMSHGIRFELTAFGLEDAENAAVDEGIADVFGNAAEMSIRGYPGTDNAGWCFVGDANENSSCRRDFKDPRNSTECFLSHAICPRDYFGPDYCPLPTCVKGLTAPCCDPHGNSTILSHWFYLLANGGSEANDTCPFKVQPLDANLETSVIKATKVLFNALRDYRPRTGFVGIADATINSAKDLFNTTSAGADAPEVRSVQAAWFAVNVTENYLGSPSAKVQPAREAKGVYPWVTFMWPIDSDDTTSAWDFQISKSSFAGTAPAGSVYTKPNIRTTVVRDGQKFGTFDLALPENDPDRYLWRVRPHVDDSAAWTDCYPIHSFVGTGQIGKVTNIRRNLIPATESGREGIDWDAVDQATGYRVRAALTDPSCTDGSDVIRVDTSVLHEGGLTAALPGILPEEHYWVNVQPVGPADSWNPPGTTADPRLGGCYKLQFDSAPLEVPWGLRPSIDCTPQNADCGYKWGVDSPVLTWNGASTVSYYTVELAERDEARKCTDVGTSLLNVAAAGRTSPLGGAPTTGTHTVLVAPPNPTGYCWRVRAVAVNGATSVWSERSQFHYFTYTKTVSPGVAPLGSGDNWDPGWFPGNTYGSPVTFQWEPSYGADAYMLKIARWPWPRWITDAPAPPDPPNCESVWCNLGPHGKVTFEDVVSETSKSLGGEAAANGRYCWTAWPVVYAPRKPLIEYEYRCYTTGPSTPKIVLDTELPTTGFSQAVASQGIRGHIHVDYVPNGQVEFEASMNGSASPNVTFGDWHGSECEIAGVHEIGRPYFTDIYNCDKQFTIHDATEGQSYEIRVKTYNSPDYPVPKMDDSTLGPVALLSIPMGTCGGENEACCDNNLCDSEGLVCWQGKCMPCGKIGLPCCAGNPCRFVNEWYSWTDHSVNVTNSSTAARCVLAPVTAEPVCVQCGLPGAMCCDPDGRAQCGDGTTCESPIGQGQICQTTTPPGTGGAGGGGGGATCGGACGTNQPCCPGNGCNPHFTCSGNSCVPDTINANDVPTINAPTINGKVGWLNESVMYPCGNAQCCDDCAAFTANVPPGSYAAWTAVPNAASYEVTFAVPSFGPGSITRKTTDIRMNFMPSDFELGPCQVGGFVVRGVNVCGVVGRSSELVFFKGY